MKSIITFIVVIIICCISSIAHAGDANDARRRQNILMRRNQNSPANRLIQNQGYQPLKHVNYDVHAIPEMQPQQIYFQKRPMTQSRGIKIYETGPASGTKIDRDGLTDYERERRSLQRQFLRYRQELN